MIKFFRRLLKDHRGNALMIAGAMLPLIVGSAGLANDTIQWTLWKRQLQRAADSAAISGAYTRYNASGSTADVSATVSHDLTLNMHNWMALKSGYPQVQYDANCAVSGSTANMTNRVCVSLAIQQKLPFSSLFLSTAPTITASATAAGIQYGSDPCVLATTTNASEVGLNNSGNTTLYMPDCVMYSNSPATNSAAAGGSSNVTAQAIATVGGVQQSNNWNVQSYRPYSPPANDPFADINPSPADMKCAGHYKANGTWVNDALDENTNMATAKDINGDPANCFTSLSVGSNKSLTVPSNYGPIYINGGDANLQGSFTCSGCTIVLTNKTSSSPIGTFTTNAQANTNITAPTTGTFKGIAVFQDRRATDCSGCNKMNGGSASVVTGAFYFPSQELWYNGGTNPVAACTMLVGRRITFTGNSNFKGLSKCAGEGLPQGGTQIAIRLVG